MTLCGTNCFVVGRGPNRTLIEAGDLPENGSGFVDNLSTFLDENDGVNLNRVLITHAHPDHFGGLHDVLDLLKQRKAPTPEIFKMLTNNHDEQLVFNRYPDLRPIVNSITDDQIFPVDEDLEIRAMHTLGHIDDHMSFLLKEKKETVLFSGDILLGTPSSVVNDLSQFMATLQRLLTIDIDYVCLPHSLHKTDPE